MTGQKIYGERLGQGTLAEDMVRYWLEWYGCVVVPTGQGHWEEQGIGNSKGLIDSVRRDPIVKYDQSWLAYWLRFELDRVANGPDLLAYHEKLGGFWVQVKSRRKRSTLQGFTVNARALRGCLRWVETFNARSGFASRLLFVFADLKTETFKCCWSAELPLPHKVHVPPASQDDKVELLSSALAFPTADQVPADWGSGSGKPAIVVRDDAKYLTELHAFFEQRYGLQPSPAAVAEREFLLSEYESP